MLRPAYGSTFLSVFKRLSEKRQQAALQAVETCLSALEQKHLLPVGLGLKKLGKEYWEIRSSLADRIIFEWSGNEVIFRLIGSHNDVRRFLRSR